MNASCHRPARITNRKIRETFTLQRGTRYGGYAYQLAGPLGPGLKPLGGRSLLIFGGEFRIKISETIGIVPFLEAGNVFEASYPNFDGALLYDGGIGLRYYTPVGPLRLDLATPIRRRTPDAPIQVYISIGQAF